MSRLTTWFAAIAMAALCFGFSAPAWAQPQIQFIGGQTSAAARKPFYAASLGLRAGFVEIDLEGGRFTDILPKGVLGAINQFQQDHGLDVQARVSLPATYALGSVRLIPGVGPIRPFISGGVGLARLEPSIDVTIDGVALGDLLGVTSFEPQTKTMLAAAAGVRFDFGAVNVEGGYRYIAIFNRYHLDSDFNNDSVLTSASAVYAALGIRF